MKGDRLPQKHTLNDFSYIKIFKVQSDLVTEIRTVLDWGWALGEAGGGGRMHNKEASGNL